MGVTLASFHSSGKIPVSIDLAKIAVIDRETMLAAILKSLFGILSNPADFLSFSLDNCLQTISSDGAVNDNEVSVGGRYVSGSVSDGGISEVSLSPMVEKCRFNSNEGS